MTGAKRSTWARAARVLSSAAALWFAAGCEPETYAGNNCLPACLVGQVCNFGTCIDAHSGAAGTIGATCTADSECSSGTCFTGATFSGGYCSDYCGAAIIAFEQECAPGSACVQLTEAVAVCLDQCGAEKGSCRSGYQCANVEGTQACLPKCASSSDCPSQQRCDLAAAVCVADDGLSDGSIGSPCSGDTQCQSGTCLDQAGSGGTWQDGYCFDVCDAGGEGKACVGKDGSAQGLCVGVPDEGGDISSHLCLAPCATGVDCRPGYMCTAGIDWKTSTGLGFCLPSCATYGCDAGQLCDSSSGVCVTGTSVASSVYSLDLGTHALGPAQSQLKPLTLQVPADAVSVMLVGQPGTPAHELALAKAVQPDGKVVLDVFDPLATDFKVVSIGPGPLAALYPNSPRLGLAAGNYTFTFGAYQNTQGKLTAVIKTAKGLLSGGQLPVVLWFTKQGRISAATAPNDVKLQQALAKMQSVYAGANIQLGPYTYIDVPGALGQGAAVIDDDAELAELFAAAGNATQQGLNLFFVEQFAGDDGGYVTLGQSGGIPGPPSLPGLPHAGVAVAVAYLDEDVATFAQTMAHEAGHYLGLFHTSEASGKSFDPLLDTAPCPSKFDSDGDGYLSAKECQGMGADNLMFWLAGGAQTVLSADQRYVLVRNPMVQTQ